MNIQASLLRSFMVTLTVAPALEGVCLLQFAHLHGTQGVLAE